MGLFLGKTRGVHVGPSAVAALALLFGSSSCDETRPKELPSSVAVDPPVAWGLDVRPVSATCLAAAKPAAPAAPLARIAYEPLTKAPLANLVDIVAQGGRTYVADRRGVIRYLASDGITAPVVMDFSDQLSFGYDSGLLSLAFHPKFAENGYVYLAYTVPHPQQPPPPNVSFVSVLGRFQSKDGGLTIDRTTEKRLIVRDQPGPNHNGNKVIFGKDGFLYFAVGDGGVLLDPPTQAQNTNELYGKILRIDVDVGDPYAIPSSNPFVQGGGAPEVYAYGLRNPWRISVDRVTGEVWAGDVGQQSFEEIDRIVPGGNYGWPIREGAHCFLPPVCSPSGLIDPIVEHPRSEASAIIGGFVYRGTAFPDLVGKYIYGDYAFGNFWALDPSVPAPVPVRLDLGLERLNPTSIGEDEKGELMFLTNTRAFRIVPPLPVTPEVPAKLTATGCFDPADPTRSIGGLFPYDVNAPQWMDGAVADRFLSIPAGARIAVEPGARLELPPGSIAARTLRRESRRVETQLLLRRPDATWSAYTYAWSADQKEALLASAPTDVPLPSGQQHRVDPLTCAGCHDPRTTGQLRTLGLEASQLDRDGVDYGGGRRGNPLATLGHTEMLSAPIAPESYVALASPSGFDTPERRSRAYLHANCAFCHDGTEPSRLDLRSFVALRDTQTCAVPGALPTGGALRLAPGNPDSSQLVTSLRAAGPGRMPPLGTTVTDEAAVTLLSSWIRALDACP